MCIRDRDGAVGEGAFTITILSNDENNPTRSVNVTVRTTPEPMLVVKPDELYFGQSENEATLMLHNLGLGDLVYEAGATAVNNALTIRLAGAASAGRRIDGTVAGLGSEMVIVEVDRAQLDLIELIGFISISSNGGAVVVPVGPRATTLEIVVPPDDLLVTLTDFGAGLTLLTRIPVIAVTDSLLDTAWIDFTATVDDAGIEIDLGSDVAPPYAVALDETYLALVPVQDRPALIGDSITFTATLYGVSGGPMEPIATDSVTVPIIEFSDTSIDTNGDGVIELEEAIGYDPTGDGVPDGRFFDIAQPATPKRSESLELDDAALASPESVLAELDAAGVTVQDLSELYDAAVTEDGVNIGALVRFAIENPEAVTLIAEKAAALGLVPGDAKVLDQPEVASRLELLAPDGIDNVIYATDGVRVTVPDATLGGSYSAVLVTTAPDAKRIATVLQVLGPAVSQDANALYNAMFATAPPEVGQLISDVCQVELMGASNTFPRGVTAFVEVPYVDVDNNGVVDGTNTVVSDLVPVVFDDGVDKTESRLVSFTLDRANRVGILEVNGFSAMALTRRLGAPPSPPPPPPPPQGSGLAGLLGIFIAFIMFLLLFGGSLPGSVGGDEACFIATAAYGTPLADQLDMLRTFRDMYLLSNPVGTDLVRLYYTHGPVIADWIANSAVLRMVTRSILWVVVGGLRTLSFAVVPVTVFALTTLAWAAKRGASLRKILAGRK